MELILQCPHCPKDKPPKLYINVDKGVFNCFRCGDFHGKLWKLKEYPEIFAILEDKLSLAEITQITSFHKPMEESSFAVLDELNPVREVLATDAQYAYLLSRGFTEGLISIYAPLVSLNPKHINRVVIPIYDSDNNLIYFSSRDITNLSHHKYANPEVPKAGIVFESQVPEALLYADSAVICEGVFDAFKIPNAIALLGKSLSQKTEKVILNKLQHKKKIYICLDVNAEDCISELARKFTTFFPNKEIYCINTAAYGNLDLGDMSKTLTPHQLFSFIKANSSLFTTQSLTDKIKDRFSLCYTN